MKTLKAMLPVVVVLGLALFIFEHQKRAKAQTEMLSLRHQVQNLIAEKERWASQLKRQESSSSMSENEKRELLRLRGETGLLRQKVHDFEQSHPAGTAPTPLIPTTPASPTHVAFGAELRDMG